MTRAFFISLGYLLLEVLTFLAISVAIILAITYLLSLLDLSVLLEQKIDRSNPYSQTLIEYLPQNIGFVAALVIMRRYIFKRSFAETGLVKRGFLPHTGLGFGQSTLLIVLGFLILWVLEKLLMRTYLFDPATFGGLLILFFFQSLSEEVMTRGFLLATIGHYFGSFWGLILSASLFSLLHFRNPNFDWIAAANIFLAGLVMGLLFLKYRNLWACTGFHWGWNFMQSAFFDFNVSGFDVTSFIRFTPLAPAWLTGGTFGFEGSILSVVFLLAFTVYLWRKVDFLPPQLPESPKLSGS